MTDSEPEGMDVDLPGALSDVDEPEALDDLDLILGGNAGNEDAGNGSYNENNENQDYNIDQDNAATGAENGIKKEPKKKRVIRNPQPKLNYQLLTGKKGLTAMREIFADIQLKGKGHELSDLGRVMTKLEYWTHRLFPRYSFDEVLSRVEKLGAKRQVEVYVKRMRLGMDDLLLNPTSKEFVEDEPPSPPPQDTMDTVFDSLLPDEPDTPAPIPTPKPTVEITAEQRERMERNRKLALERRLARMDALKAQERLQAGQPTNELSCSQDTGSPSPLTSEPATSSAAVPNVDAERVGDLSEVPISSNSSPTIMSPIRPAISLNSEPRARNSPSPEKSTDKTEVSQLETRSSSSSEKSTDKTEVSQLEARNSSSPDKSINKTEVSQHETEFKPAQNSELANSDIIPDDDHMSSEITQSDSNLLAEES